MDRKINTSQDTASFPNDFNYCRNTMNVPNKDRRRNK